MKTFIRDVGAALLLLLCSAQAWAQSSPLLRVEEVDGSPGGRGITKIVVTNGSLTVSGRVATIATSGGASVNATDGTIPYRSSAAAFTDSPLAVASSAVTLTRSAIGATSADGLILTNPTAAAAGAQQFSPRLRLTGQGWKTTATAASQTVDWMMENQPVQGSSAPTSNFVLSSQANGSGYTARLTINGNGVTTFNTASILVGTGTTFGVTSGARISYSSTTGTATAPGGQSALTWADTGVAIPAGSSLTIGSGGAAVTGHLSATASLDFGATAAGTCDTLTVTVTGAADGDTVALGIPNALAASDTYQTFFGWVSAADTVSVKRCNLLNLTTALSNPAAATVRATVLKY